MVKQILRDARAALDRGDLLSAYDLASSAIAVEPGNQPLKSVQVLALARMGDLDQAVCQYRGFAAAGARDLEFASLGARLLKDEALKSGRINRTKLASAFNAYAELFRRTRAVHPGVNAASLALLCGRDAEALRIARAVLRQLEYPRGYYERASRAEAFLVCGKIDEAAHELRQACAAPDASVGSRTTTRRQFNLIAGHLKLSRAQRAELLKPLLPPAVFMFCGHLMPVPDPAAERRLAREIDSLLNDEQALIGYGALANGADIIVAERLLRAKGELNVVLPFQTADFVRQSVGPAWEKRFQACLRRASSVTMATEMPYMGDPSQFSFGSMVAMGLARLRAAHLDSRVLQIAIWDKEPAGKSSPGTAADVRFWKRSGGKTYVIAPAWRRARFATSKAAFAPKAPRKREMRAIVFADFKGYSKLPENLLPMFWNEAMRRVAGILRRRKRHVRFQNSWGDAIYAVVSSAVPAAGIVLDLQRSVSRMDRRSLGGTANLAMRIGAHFGPLYSDRDAITGRRNYYGMEVSRTARIEPITPPGAVYVTEQFAAMLALDGRARFSCAYVGQVQLAKGFGVSRMYRLDDPA